MFPDVVDVDVTLVSLSFNFLSLPVVVSFTVFLVITPSKNSDTSSPNGTNLITGKLAREDDCCCCRSLFREGLLPSVMMLLSVSS